LTLLIVGLHAAKRPVLAQIARKLHQQALTAALAESIGRRRRRTLNDPQLDPVTCSHPAGAQVVAWPGRPAPRRAAAPGGAGRRPTEAVHRCRVGPASWGGSLPWAWAGRARPAALAAGQERPAVDRGRAEVAALPPVGGGWGCWPTAPSASPPSSTGWIATAGSGSCG
jgi:hypothetical protein